MKVAVFPGSFDPVTLGHIDIINKSERIFDKVIIGIGENNSKKSFFSEKKKIEMLKKCLEGKKTFSVQTYNNLTIDFCKLNNIKFIIRGLRNTTDFEYENQMALMNEDLDKSITTIFIPCCKKYSSISSTLVKEIIKNRGEFEKFLPKEIIPFIMD